MDKKSDIFNYSIFMLSEFDKRLNECENTTDYSALVASVFLFNDLMLSNFRGTFLQDGSEEEYNQFLFELKEQTKLISDSIIKNWGENNLH